MIVTRKNIDKLLKLLVLSWIVMTLVLLAVMVGSTQSNRSDDSQSHANIAAMIPQHGSLLLKLHC
jgi:hypothetical protein